MLPRDSRNECFVVVVPKDTISLHLRHCNGVEGETPRISTTLVTRTEHADCHGYLLILMLICIEIPPIRTKANVVTTSLDTQEIHLERNSRIYVGMGVSFCLRSIPPWLSSIGWAWDTGQSCSTTLGMLTSCILLLLLYTKAPSNRSFKTAGMYTLLLLR